MRRRACLKVGNLKPVPCIVDPEGVREFAGEVDDAARCRADRRLVGLRREVALDLLDLAHEEVPRVGEARVDGAAGRRHRERPPPRGEVVDAAEVFSELADPAREDHALDPEADANDPQVEWLVFNERPRERERRATDDLHEILEAARARRLRGADLLELVGDEPARRICTKRSPYLDRQLSERVEAEDQHLALAWRAHLG